MTLRTIRTAGAERPPEDVGDRVTWLLDEEPLEADLAEAPVKKFYAAYEQWPRNKMRVYRDPYEELILVQWHSQWRIRNTLRAAAERLQPDAAARVTILADHHVASMSVLRDVLREGRAG